MKKAIPDPTLTGAAANSGIFSSARRRSPSVFPEVLTADEGLMLLPGYHHDILNTLPEIAFELDADGGVRFINETALRLLGKPREEIEGKPLGELVAADAARPGIVKALGGENPGPLEFEMVRNDGGRLPVRCSLTIIELGGKVVGLRGIATDMSENARMRDELEKASRRKASYESAARSGHDIRNILCVLQGGISFLGAIDYRHLGERDVNDIEDTLRDAQEAIQRGVDLTTDMMQLAAAERMVFGEVDVGGMVDRIVKERRQAWAGKGIAFITDCEPVILKRADRGKLHRAIDNIIANALDSMETGGGILKVRVTEGITGGAISARITVRDTGCGIPSEMLDSVFEPFISTKGSKGTGLGLAIAAAVIENHGGTIDLESEPGRGTVFDIVLPCELKET